MKNLLSIIFALLILNTYSQNIGINQVNPTNSLHVSPVSPTDNPIRIDGLKSFTIGDTSLLILNQSTGIVKYITTNDFVNIINNSGGLGSDDQNIDSIIIAGTNLTIYIENGANATVDLSSFQDADGDPTNEIELPSSGIVGQVLTWDGTDWVAQNAGAGADNWGTQTVVTGTGLSGNGTIASPLVSTFTEVDGVIGNEYNTSVVLNNTNLETTDGGGTIITDLSALQDGTGTDNQTLSLLGNTLSISNGNNVTLIDNVNDADFVIGNEYNTGASLSGTNLNIIDGGGTQTVNLSSLVDHDWYEVGGTSAPNSITDNIYTQGSVGIGITNPSELLELNNGGLQINQSYGIGFAGAEPYNNPVTNDQARMYYDNNYFGTNQDALVIEKTDGNNTNPDGGIAFTMKGSDNSRDLIMSLRGNGNVGIGTSTPSEKLDVQGSVKIVDGTQGNGKVLTSDAAGKASWQTPSTSLLLSVTYPYGTSAPTNTFTANSGGFDIVNFTAPSNGLYMICAVVTVNIVGAQFGDYSSLQQNAQTYCRLYGGGSSASEEHLSEDATKQISMSYLFSLTAGDVVNFRIEQQQASTFGFSGLEMRVVKF